MAKTQTFGDKLKKKKADDGIHVKVVKGVRTEKGSLAYLERFVKVNDLSELDKIDVSK
jgi:glycerol-3-phosphate responsive antiterminator